MKTPPSAFRVLGRLGVDRAEITLLEEQVLHALAEAGGPMDPKQLKEELGDSVRSLGEEGKKKGATTTLPTTLGILQSQGRIRRVPVNGRLDQQRYAYELWDLPPSTLDADAARTELIRRYLGWTGGATLKQSQWFTGFTVAQSKAGLAAVGAVEVPTAAGEVLWMMPDDVERLAVFEEPAEEQIQLLAGTDSLALLRRNAADLLAEEGPEGERIAEKVLASLALQADLPDHPILDRGRIIGLWQYEPGKERIVSWLFHGATPAVTRRIAEVEAWIRRRPRRLPRLQPRLTGRPAKADRRPRSVGRRGIAASLDAGLLGEGQPARWEAKKSRSSAAHSGSRTPAYTSTQWLSRRSRRMSNTEPAAPAFSSQAPKTTRGIRARTIAPAHMAHGSSVTTRVQSASRQPSPGSPSRARSCCSRAAASRMATISACAVGSPSASRSLRPEPSTPPSGPITTAPIGTSSVASARRASARARPIHSAWRGSGAVMGQ